jgi:hypothetical protein
MMKRMAADSEKDTSRMMATTPAVGRVSALPPPLGLGVGDGGAGQYWSRVTKLLHVWPGIGPVVPGMHRFEDLHQMLGKRYDKKEDKKKHSVHKSQQSAPCDGLPHTDGCLQCLSPILLSSDHAVCTWHDPHSLWLAQR